jgi:hypothetical protein
MTPAAFAAKQIRVTCLWNSPNDDDCPANFLPLLQAVIVLFIML